MPSLWKNYKFKQNHDRGWGQGWEEKPENLDHRTGEGHGPEICESSQEVFGKNMKEKNDLTGKVFGRWTVIKLDRKEKRSSFWEVKCECGTIKVVYRGSLTTGRSKSCGCLCAERISLAKTTHGHTANGKTSLTYRTWVGMWSRCTNKNEDSYPHYGGRGILIDPQWEKFENFLSDMGVKPVGMSIERIDNDKNYCKENCRWATDIEQANNKRNSRILTHNNASMSLCSWARKVKISPKTIQDRLHSGWEVSRALDQQVRTPKLSALQITNIRADYAAGLLSQRKLAEKNGVSQRLILDILKGRIYDFARKH
jgi:ribosomal protein S27E